MASYKHTRTPAPQPLLPSRPCNTEQVIVRLRSLLPSLIIPTDSALYLFWVASACLWGTHWHRDKLSSS